MHEFELFILIFSESFSQILWNPVSAFTIFTLSFKTVINYSKKDNRLIICFLKCMQCIARTIGRRLILYLTEKTLFTSDQARAFGYSLVVKICILCVIYSTELTDTELALRQNKSW